MNGADFTLYIDENTTPVLTGTLTKARTDNWFKFGDPSASFSHSGLYDYIIWDVTVAYAPGQGAPIPDTLSKHYYGKPSNLSDHPSDAVLLYPNPSSGEITITSPVSWINTEYMIINPLGQVMRKGTITGEVKIINTRDLSSGTYALIIRSGDNTLHHEQFIHTSL